MNSTQNEPSSSWGQARVMTYPHSLSSRMRQALFQKCSCSCQILGASVCRAEYGASRTLVESWHWMCILLHTEGNTTTEWQGSPCLPEVHTISLLRSGSGDVTVTVQCNSYDIVIPRCSRTAHTHIYNSVYDSSPATLNFETICLCHVTSRWRYDHS